MSKLDEYTEKLQICGDGRNSYAKTDHSATFRGSNAVRTEILLVAIGHNLYKYYNKKQKM